MADNPNPNAASTDLTSREIGDYFLLRRLGRGGMADVYLAEQKSLRRNVALKILKPELATDDSYVKRFQREAQAVASLVQANIVQIYEVGCDEGLYYIAQEYVRGRNLKQYLDRHGAVEPVMAINVLRQAALALQTANELGVIHRDIKPENIMLSTKGEVKVTDFGLARLKTSHDSSEKALTQIGITMGTPLYMSPEQVGGDTLDHRSDIYSLGVTAFHMLAGEPPFDGETALAIAVQHVNKTPPSLGKIRPDIPERLIDIVNKMIQKKPGQRQSGADQLLKELRDVKLDSDEDWEAIVEKLTVGPTSGNENVSTTLSQAQLAATRQLQRVMNGGGSTWWLSWRFAGIAVLLGFAGVASGVLLANATRPESLLQVQDYKGEKIPRKKDVEQQYLWANLLVSAEQRVLALKKVVEYFPAEDGASGDIHRRELFHRRAKLRLGEEYLKLNQFTNAERCFQELSELGELAEDFRVAGLAGLAITYHQMPENQFVARGKRRQVMLSDLMRKLDGRESILKLVLAEPYLGQFQAIREQYSQSEEAFPIINEPAQKNDRDDLTGSDQ